MAQKNTVNKTTLLGLGDMNLEHLYRLGDELIIADHFDVKRAFPPYFRTAMPVCIILKKGYLRGRCNLMDIDAVAPCMSILLPDQILEFTESSDDLEGMVVMMSARFTERLNIKVDFDLMQAFQSQRVIPLNEEALATMLQFCENGEAPLAILRPSLPNGNGGQPDPCLLFWSGLLLSPAT